MIVMIASHNQGKIKEFKEMFKNTDIEVKSLLDYPDVEEVEETGTTFEENARLKAETIANELQVIALADDSGLVVPSLNGKPGVYSARYSGEPKDDQRNNQKLLTEMASFEGEDRQAYFQSVLVLAYPNNESLVVEGRAKGYILKELSGDDGFGYDPLFYYPEKDQTFAEMPLAEKNKISHRAKAMQELNKKIDTWMKELDIYENDDIK
ncbi:XTP/dITP diphosphatase [Ruoffia tabacinasalis]|uniref:dITP/XTP pyrophosphatase n=2 Tax=Ruoffia tabacinasalis TaxID=87458 RepID=A0A5R9EEZ3_9LACT|nr:XTP/dITP diphosphatase [Ruoffia tabacinasalis]